MKDFRFRLTIGYIIGTFDKQWGNPNGWGLSIAIGIGLLKPTGE